MCRQQIAFNDICSETTRLTALVFGMKHCLVDLYQFSSNGGPDIQNGSVAEALVFEKTKYA